MLYEVDFSCKQSLCGKKYNYIYIKIKMLSFLTSRSFGHCPSTISSEPSTSPENTSEASTMTNDYNTDKKIMTRDAQTQTTEEKRNVKRSRYIEMDLDESDCEDKE